MFLRLAWKLICIQRHHWFILVMGFLDSLGLTVISHKQTTLSFCRICCFVLWAPIPWKFVPPTAHHKSTRPADGFVSEPLVFLVKVTPTVENNWRKSWVAEQTCPEPLNCSLNSLRVYRLISTEKCLCFWSWQVSFSVLPSLSWCVLLDRAHLNC